MSFGTFSFGEIPNPITSLPNERSERALAFRNGLISAATGGSIDDGVYKLLRSEFMAEGVCAALLPKFIKTCADAGDFWQFIKYEFATYRERRDFLREAFRPLIDHLEKSSVAPAAEPITASLTAFDAESVAQVWHKAVTRVSSDPEGAITSARTLLETVCKHILDEGVEPGSLYVGLDDLPKLYAGVAKRLNIAPSQHTEGVFKQILGGCSGVVEGLGALRNRVGDAHGQGKRPVKVQPRHAMLAVNLAGTMATFLVETSLARKAD